MPPKDRDGTGPRWLRLTPLSLKRINSSNSGNLKPESNAIGFLGMWLGSWLGWLAFGAVLGLVAGAVIGFFVGD